MIDLAGVKQSFGVAGLGIDVVRMVCQQGLIVRNGQLRLLTQPRSERLTRPELGVERRLRRQQGKVTLRSGRTIGVQRGQRTQCANIAVIWVRAPQLRRQTQGRLDLGFQCAQQRFGLLKSPRVDMGKHDACAVPWAEAGGCAGFLQHCGVERHSQVGTTFACVSPRSCGQCVGRHPNAFRLQSFIQCDGVLAASSLKQRDQLVKQQSLLQGPPRCNGSANRGLRLLRLCKFNLAF